MNLSANGVFYYCSKFKVSHKVIICLLLFIIFASCNKEVTGPQPFKEKATGTILISSKPVGAIIFLNNFNTGKITPDSIAALDTGNYKITLKTNSWLDTTFSIKLKSSERAKLFCDYTINPKNYSTIECISNPSGAEIIMNDSSTGKSTPCTFQFLNPGKYKITTRIKYFRDDTQEINLQFGEKTKLNFALQDTSVWVDFNPLKSGFPTNNVNCLCNFDNSLWIGTQGSGLIKNNGGKSFTVYNTNNSPIPENNVTQLREDRGGNLWILCESSVVIYSKGVFTCLKTEDIDPAILNIIGVAFTNDDNIPYILATVRKQSSTVGRVLKYYAGKWTMVIDNLPSPQAIETDYDDRLWISANGLIVYSESFIHENYSVGSPGLSKLPQSNIVKIVKWFGRMYIVADITNLSVTGTGGLYSYKDGVFTNYSLPSRSLTSFNNTKEGNILLSLGAKIFIKNLHQAGIIYYSNGKGTLYDSKNTPIPINNCLDITEFQNDVYVATWGNGLIKFKPGKIIQ